MHVIQHLTVHQTIAFIREAKKHTSTLLIQEACLDYMTEVEAEEQYLKSPAHMIWKPIKLIEQETNTEWNILKKLSVDSQIEIKL